MKRPRCVYSLDWVQLYCDARHAKIIDGYDVLVSPIADKWGNHREYRLTDAKEYIKGYAFNRSVYYRSYTVAVIAWSPRNANNDPFGCAIKVANAVLYVADWHFILADILASLGWVARSVTRIDICCDLNYFVNGLLPETFIRKYLMRKGATYIRDGSNKWACYGLKELHNNEFESIRWGSRKSGVSVYLYNKSKELGTHLIKRSKSDADLSDDEGRVSIGQKYKPYIVASWEKACLDVRKVWRVEISINSSGRGLKDVNSGFIRSLFVDELNTQLGIESIFKVFARRYFSFRKVERGCSSRKRDLPHVELLDFSGETILKPTTLYHSGKSTRTERIVCRELTELKEQLYETDGFQNLELANALSLVLKEYSQRSFLANQCEKLGKQISDVLKENVEEHITKEGYMQRFKNGADLISDGEYMKDVSARLASRIKEYTMDGVIV